MRNAATILLFCLTTLAHAQLWHGRERTIHYLPDGRDFVCVNGTHRFNRALYGTNTAFRVEAGDLPEFAMYMPGMGGNLKLGIVRGGRSKWITEADTVKATYRPGRMIYEVKDKLLDNGKMKLTVLALANAEGMIVQTSFENIPEDARLFAAYGGASGKKFSRDGDLGADPESSFYLKPEYCKDNIYQIEHNSFTLQYGSGKVLTEDGQYELPHNQKGGKPTSKKNVTRYIIGVFPSGMLLKTGAANDQRHPLAIPADTQAATPLVYGDVAIAENTDYYFLLQPQSSEKVSYSNLPQLFITAEAKRKALAERIIVSTPDSFINTLGGALAVAADAIWESPTYLHGAVAWRMRLNAWRGAYCADALGWHDRAKLHFSSYALSQVTSPEAGPIVADTQRNLARQKEELGTSLFSSGYICRNPNGDFRAHHYDMNLVFIDQLINHFSYTGDTTFLRKMFPVIKRHLDWEKRNFDADDDGLYDAYAAIWASDALQYSGGGVTHSSAYNYKANRAAADFARILGEDGRQYELEADKIWNAMQSNLWIDDKGVMAEYREWGNNHRLHESPGLWTIYHTIDSKAADDGQSREMVKYVNEKTPHIPIIANGLEEKDLYMLSTTNWQPYDWSINNVAMAEQLHTALAFWQAGDNEEAFRMWKSALVESMYLGTSPGNFEQLSFYDAVRGELYRDFADPVGMAARSLTEGLFGIEPDVLHDTLKIHPGFPASWDSARLTTPDIDFKFKKKDNKDIYSINSTYYGGLTLELSLNIPTESIHSIEVNGKKVCRKFNRHFSDSSVLAVLGPASASYNVEILWKGNRKPIEEPAFKQPLPKPKGMIRCTTSLSSYEFWGAIPKFHQDCINIKPYFNDAVTNIFKHKYLSPRPTAPTLQLPTQGIGNWCYPFVEPEINDSGLRATAGKAGAFIVDHNIRFETPSSAKKNIIFTSLWDNFPDSVVVPLKDSASEIFLLMTGTTNPMQSRIDNGLVMVTYKDGSQESLLLNNPENWSPIEQDYYDDGYAFTTGATKPVRISLKTGAQIGEDYKYTSIKGFSNRAIDGGAATVLHMDLDKTKKLKSLTIKTLSSDVVIGLMAATLVK